MLLEALEPGRYQAAGAYHPPAAPNAGLPVEWTGTLSRESGRITIQGKYRHQIGAAEHPFRLELALPAGLLERGSFELESSHLGSASGAFRALGGGIVFGGRVAQSGVTVSLKVEVLRPGFLDCKGTLVFADGAVWLYHFEALPSEFRLAKADVLSLGARRA